MRRTLRDFADSTALVGLWLLWIVIALVTLPVAAYRALGDRLTIWSLTAPARRRVDRIRTGRAR